MEDEFYRYAPFFDCYTIRPSELTEGKYVARINSKEKIIENKYVVVKIHNKDNRKLIKVACYDFIENKIDEFDGINVFNFFDVSAIDNLIDFHYKYKYTSLDEYKKLNIGDKVLFINPENIKTRPTPLFKIVKKQKKQGDCGRFDLMDGNGYVIHNVPGILLLKEVNGKEEIKMKKDELFTNFEDYILDPYDLNAGLFVAKINFKKKIIENKYIVTSVMKHDEIINRVECFDFVTNNEVTFDGIDIFTFLKVNVDNEEHFQYKYEYSSRNYFKQLKVGDEVEFVQPIGSPITPHYVFKIIEKMDGINFISDRVILEDKLGGKMYNVPAILLTDTCEEKINNKFNNVPGGMLKHMFDIGNKKECRTYPIRSMKSKTPTKLKFTIDIDYTNDTPIKLKLKEEGSSYSRNTLIAASLDEKIKVSNALKDVSFREIFLKNILKIKNEEDRLISGKSKYWRFIPFNFNHIESRLYDTSDLTCHIDLKSGNFFKSKEDLIINSDAEKVKKIKENLAKYILEN